MLDLKLISYAQALSRHRNFARAAESLDLSQPALSRSIAGLEKSLGIPLFERTSQGVEPTAFGERFLALGEDLLRNASDLERELRLMQGLDTGVLRVGAGPYPADMCVAPALARLVSRCSRLRIELSSSDWRAVVKDLLQENVDIAVVELTVIANEPRLSFEPLPQHECVYYCRAGHPLLEEPGPTLERLFEFPFAGPRLPVRASQAFQQRSKYGVIDPITGDYVPPIRVDTVGLAINAVLSGDAIGIAPPELIADEIVTGRVVAFPFREAWLHTNYGFVFLKDRVLSPACQAFIAEVKSIEAELVARRKERL